MMTNLVQIGLKNVIARKKPENLD
ncbi:hypothetical protein Gogos_020297 [Gossypium gossypioides]|uniref:Uncharacterized protein n=1 Tax=Gossypium gossypioides TaxID=34282 RepID=A0A7J9D2G3_GOSGO|nr:hypothetical protein [Gossypium gossypioides]